MKLLLVTVFIAVVYTAGDRVDEDDVQLEEDLISAERTDISLDGHQVKIDDMEMLLSRSRWCRKRGGRCSRRKFSCGKGYQESPLGRPYCTSKKRRCCYPAQKGCPKDFFQTNASSQCFKLFSGERNWFQANDTCHTAGLLLAQPEDPISVRRYLVEQLGTESLTWLGARGNGTAAIWLRGGKAISNSSSYWYNGGPYSGVDSSRCLWMLSTANWYSKQPNAPYLFQTCSYTGRWSKYTLCELVME